MINRLTNLHGIWEKTDEEICRRAMYVAKFGYRIWVVIYVAVLLASIGFPLVAIILDDNLYARAFAAMATIAASLNAVLHPGEKAGVYDNAVQNLWAARISYIKNNNSDELLAEIKKALNLMKITYVDGEVVFGSGKPSS